MSSAGEFRQLREPLPRVVELPFEPYRFQQKARRLLSVPQNVASAPCLEVLHMRRSRRTFKPIPEDRLSSLLWFAAKTLRTHCEPSGFGWQHRPAPSSGGRHPIYILVLTPDVDPAVVSVYEPEGHALIDFDPLEPRGAIALAEGLEAVLPRQSGTVLWFVADYARTWSRYQHCESLVWRDSGALLATVYIAAEALGLNCCAYGVVGDIWVSRILPASRFVSVGGCVVGGR
jgi:SagB-type dehydrogenase family enzyme